jgi:hypothetical protein
MCAFVSLRASPPTPHPLPDIIFRFHLKLVFVVYTKFLPENLTVFHVDKICNFA